MSYAGLKSSQDVEDLIAYLGRFTAVDGAPVMAFPGLWDRWTDPASCNEVLSATIIVSGASAWMAPYHDRMPVLLGDDDPTIVEPMAAMG